MVRYCDAVSQSQMQLGKTVLGQAFVSEGGGVQIGSSVGQTAK